MAPLRLGGRIGFFALLLTWVVLLGVVQSLISQGALRLVGWTLLAPLVGGALLTFRQTLLVCGATVLTTLVAYGFLARDIAVWHRLLAVALVTVACALSLVVGRVRLGRERRISGLMVARERLTLLSVASTHVGSTLDVDRTARELVEAAVPRFADTAVVDLFDPVLHGEEPAEERPRGPVTVRRVAGRTVDEGDGVETFEPGGTDTYEPGSVPGRCLATGKAARAGIQSASEAASWLGADPAEARFLAPAVRRGPQRGEPAPGRPDAAAPGRDGVGGDDAGGDDAGRDDAPPGGAGRPAEEGADGPGADRAEEPPGEGTAPEAAEAEGTAPEAAEAGAAGRRPEGRRKGRGRAKAREPAARRHDYHSGIAVPLRARGATLGVAVFLRSHRPEPFDADDLLLAEEIGARAAVCVDNARRYTHEHHTSLTLQRSLLPRRLPEQAAVDVATRYLPADTGLGVGGDWFDVIQLSGARVALVVGDVVGHGLYASATMGRLRAAVRTLADIDLPPDELLTHLDDVLIRLRAETGRGDGGEPGEGQFADAGATCLYAVYDPVSRMCSLARAGHPEPALVRPDGSVEFIGLPAGPPLGVGGLPFEATELRLPENSLLALYTNGLIEAGGHDLDLAMDELRNVLARPGSSLEATCDAVLREMLDGDSRLRPKDDVALLLARTHALDASHVGVWDVPSDPTAVGRARELVNRQLADWGLPEAAFSTELIVSELVTNAIRHAGGPIRLRVIRENSLICEVSDGSSTTPHLRRARTLDENGRGLFIVAQLTQRWGTRQTSEGKTIWAEFSALGSGL
ncbi:ATP-binding SpoIIE family protein phosphatase [Streptomyces hoynatensis]|uniref:ATP-binding SpoIIE family protein phosphatase n=1 Tax=Streptomyces hoynatensis TaxID=1141874 RepID=UPI001F4D7BC5|nr:SpoIIE family protein phosphatase [Streptomyces hoynatensis]